MTTRNRVATGLAALALGITGWCTYDVLSYQPKEDTIEDVRNVEEEEVLETKVSERIVKEPIIVEKPKSATPTKLIIPTGLPKLEIDNNIGLGQKVFEEFRKGDCLKDSVTDWLSYDIQARFQDIEKKYGPEKATRAFIEFHRALRNCDNYKSSKVISGIYSSLKKSTRIEAGKQLFSLLNPRNLNDLMLSRDLGRDLLKDLLREKDEDKRKASIAEYCRGKEYVFSLTCFGDSSTYTTSRHNACQDNDALFDMCRSAIQYDPKSVLEVLGNIPPELQIAVEFMEKFEGDQYRPSEEQLIYLGEQINKQKCGLFNKEKLGFVDAVLTNLFHLKRGFSVSQLHSKQQYVVIDTVYNNSKSCK